MSTKPVAREPIMQPRVFVEYASETARPVEPWGAARRTTKGKDAPLKKVGRSMIKKQTPNSSEITLAHLVCMSENTDTNQDGSRPMTGVVPRTERPSRAIIKGQGYHWNADAVGEAARS